MAHKMTRREMLRRTTLAGVAVFTTRRASWAEAKSPNDKLNHACIGVGGMIGGADYKSLSGHPRVRIAALCDADTQFLARVAKEQPDARCYTDWRELFEREGDRIDSVNVSVPDHMHAAITMTALRKGKHVYCQKPLCHDVAEIRAVIAAAKAAGVRTQLGTQGASTTVSRMAVQMIQEGVIGTIRRVVHRQHRPDSGRYRLTGPRPEKTQQPPAKLKWDLWIGTAPMRPYAPGIYHPVMWRTWLDFGTGWLGDIGCHQFHFPWRALELTAPTTITAKVQQSWVDSPARRADTWPQSAHVRWTFPATKYTEGELAFEWYDGEFMPDQDVCNLIDQGEYDHSSVLMIGTKGALMLSGGSVRLFPHAKFQSAPRPRPQGAEHHRDFVDACFSGRTTESDFAFSGPMAEAVLLGSVAQRVPGQVLKWDCRNMKITNCPEAQAFLRRSYRDGWAVEGV